MPRLCLYISEESPDRDWAGSHACFDSDEVAAGEWLIGRLLQADLTLSDMSVSRRHAAIRYSYAADRWTVEDLGSTQHTWLNNKRLSPGDPAPLAIGDELRLGDYRLRVVEDEFDTLGQPLGHDDEGPTTVVSPTPLNHITGAEAIALPAAPRTFADVAYLGASWLFSPATPLGAIYRLVVLAAAVGITIIILGGHK